jgi:integrase
VKIKGFPTRSGTCPTKECARECARQAELATKGGAVLKRLTLGELIDQYVELHLPTIPDSSALYQRHLLWWRKKLGEIYADAVTPQMVAACKLELRSYISRFGRPLSPGTVNRYLTTLSSLYSWAARADIALVSSHPVRDVVRLKEPPGRMRWLSRPVDGPNSELERLLSACRESDSLYLFDIVLLLLSTGCREGEILQLRREDIRLADGGFMIPAGRSKTEEPRFVPLEGPGLEVARQRLATPGEGSDFLFPGAPGKPTGFPKRAWATALRRSGIKNLRPHDLRHTHGSYLGMLGKTLPEIMEALGHKTPAVALRYIHIADSHKGKVSAEVNAQLADWIGNTG